MNSIVKEDVEYIYNNVGKNLEKFKNSNVFITGCCGFLGYYFLHFFNTFKDVLGIKSIVAVDNQENRNGLKILQKTEISIFKCLI